MDNTAARAAAAWAAVAAEDEVAWAAVAAAADAVVAAAEKARAGDYRRELDKG